MNHRALRLIRVFHDLRPVDLARKLGISRSYLCEIERGKKKATLELIESYSKVFQLPASAIVLFSEQLRDRERNRARFEFRQSVQDKITTYLELVDRFEKTAPAVAGNPSAIGAPKKISPPLTSVAKATG